MFGCLSALLKLKLWAQQNLHGAFPRFSAARSNQSIDFSFPLFSMTTHVQHDALPLYTVAMDFYFMHLSNSVSNKIDLSLQSDIISECMYGIHFDGQIATHFALNIRYDNHDSGIVHLYA